MSFISCIFCLHSSDVCKLLSLLAESSSDVADIAEMLSTTLLLASTQSWISSVISVIWLDSSFEELYIALNFSPVSAISSFCLFTVSIVFVILSLVLVIVLSSTLIVLPISSALFLVCSESERISSATTAKPFPASPALAASMLAFKASRLVCEDMLTIVERISLTASASCCNSPVSATVSLFILLTS